MCVSVSWFVCLSVYFESKYMAKRRDFLFSFIIFIPNVVFRPIYNTLSKINIKLLFIMLMLQILADALTRLRIVSVT